MKTTSHCMSLTIFELGWNVLEVLWIWGSGDVEMSHTNRPSLEKEMNTVYSVLLLGCRAGGHLQPQEWISVAVFNGVFHIFDECPGIPVMWPSRKKATPKPPASQDPQAALASGLSRKSETTWGPKKVFMTAALLVSIWNVPFVQTDRWVVWMDT